MPSRRSLRLSSSASTVMRPVTISQEVNERALTTASSCCCAGQLAPAAGAADLGLAGARGLGGRSARSRPAAAHRGEVVARRPIASSAASDQRRGHHGTCDRLRVDRLDRSPVFAGEPVVGQMQVDTGGFDRAVPGLGLDRLQRHPGLAQPGETGVPQLMTGQMFDPGAPSGAGDDLVEPGRAQRPSTTLALEHDEHAIRRRRCAAAPAPGSRPRW